MTAQKQALSDQELSILSSEYAALQSMRAEVHTESNSRLSGFLTILSSLLVSLAFVRQITEDESAFLAFLGLLIPLVIFLGFSSLARIAQLNSLNIRYIHGMNIIRGKFMQAAPDLEDAFVLPGGPGEAGVDNVTHDFGGPMRTLTSTLFIFLGFSLVLAGIWIYFMSQAILGIERQIALIAAFLASLVLGALNVRYLVNMFYSFMKRYAGGWRES